MRIIPVTEVGAYRRPCTARVRVAAGLVTTEAQRRAWRMEKAGLPIDQCGARADFHVDGQLMCRMHASAAALKHVLQETSS